MEAPAPLHAVRQTESFLRVPVRARSDELTRIARRFKLLSGFSPTLPQRRTARRSPTAAMTAKEKQLAAVSVAAGRPVARLPLLKQLGPGLITGAADDDPSGIASYSQAGAQFGYG